MKIDVNIKVDEEHIMNPEEKEVASGWVEIEDCLKFPVKVRKYTDKITGEQKMFVSYPQRKKGAGYEGVVYPHDKEVRKEIEDRVLETVQNNVVKNINLPEVEAVRVNLVKQTKESFVVLRGVATLKIAGMTINGIAIKEGQKGLFVQMPQYKSGNEYKDTVYGTNTGIHSLIKNEVIKAYEEVVKEENKHQEEKEEQAEKTEQEQGEQQAEQQEQRAEQEIQQTEKEEQEQQAELVVAQGLVHSSIDRFMQAYEARDTQEMLAIFAEAEKEIGNAKFTENGNAVRLQGAVMTEGDRMIDFGFYNSWNPLQQIPPSEYLEQSIEARIYKNGNIIGLTVLTERKSKSLKNAEKNYDEILSMWKELTNQEKIEIPREQQKQEVRAEKRYAAPGL